MKFIELYTRLNKEQNIKVYYNGKCWYAGKAEKFVDIFSGKNWIPYSNVMKYGKVLHIAVVENELLIAIE